MHFILKNINRVVTVNNNSIKSDRLSTKASFASMDVSRNTRNTSEHAYRRRRNRERPVVNRKINIGKWLLLTTIVIVALLYLFG